MKWVTWENVAVDRMACAWLIQRWLDPEPEFIFVPADTQNLPANAVPFDIPGAELSHHAGHCTFHAMLQKYHLNDPVLDRIAGIVDEADVAHDINGARGAGAGPALPRSTAHQRNGP